MKIIATCLCILICSSCIKEENPCHGAKHIKADFYTEEICTSSCGPFWQNYRSNICSGGWMRFVSSSFINTPVSIHDTASYEWHIGAGVYYGDLLELNFSNATNGSVIPVMLIVRQTPNPTCIPNDNGVDSIVQYITIDKGTKFSYGTWQGSFINSSSNITTVIIKKAYNAVAQDTFLYIVGLSPPYDSLVGSTSSLSFYRQENNFTIYGNGTFNIYGNALTDSSGQNIVISYQYLDTPSYTKLIKKTFNGKRI